MCVRAFANQAFFVQRMDLYEKRKVHMLNVLRDSHDMMSNQARFIKEFVDGDLEIVSVCFSSTRHQVHAKVVFPHPRIRIMCHLRRPDDLRRTSLLI